MTDEQLDRLEQMLVDLGEYGRFKWLPGVRTLLADYRRLRDLERAVKEILTCMDFGTEKHWYLAEGVTRTQRDTIGRLLDGEK